MTIHADGLASCSLMGKSERRAERKEQKRAAASDDEDDEPPQKEPKKSKKDAPLQGLKGLKRREWAGHELTPFTRVLWTPEPDEEVPSDERVRTLRKSLGLRVPEVRAKQCKFWQQGKCTHGDACRFAHGDDATARGATCPPPLQGLGHPSLPRLVGRAMLHLGHREPTSIQAQAWPAALAGLDIVCRSPTGSGKTLAYLLPAMAHVLAAKPPLASGSGPAALVLVPTRELAIQVAGVSRGLKRMTGVVSGALYGGDPREEQCEMMEGVVPLLIATTGRLIDMLGTKHVKLGRVTMLILDEADTLISLGFSEQVHQICGQLRPDRQTLLFSATLSDRLEAAAGSWLKSPVRIYADPVVVDESGEAPLIGDEGEALSLPPTTVTQRFVLCGAASGGKRASLLSELQQLGSVPIQGAKHVVSEPSKPKERNLTKVLVFVNQIKDMKDLAQGLRKAGARCDVLHGERSQREREEALLRFRNGQAPVLLCSDVAARGIDVPRLPAVINFDPPATLTQYTHRLGRTGRQGAGGTVISLLKTDAASRHFAGQARTLLGRMGLPLPEALEPLLAEAVSGQRAPAVTSELKAQDTEPPLPPLQAMGSLMDFAASFA